ncbi:MAG: Holliday junction resolvase RuvX [Bacteroidetes bacterium]|nr:Holliday junction resolvase RuvX [Bacteroidota bacterium]
MINPPEKRFLSIDYGSKRVGIAITDPLKMFAYPLVTIINDSKFWEKFLNIFNEFDVEKIILGYPLLKSGDKSKSTFLVEGFKKELEKKLKDIPIELVDESYSSQKALENIMESVPSKKKRRDKSLIDKNAASVILQEYLSGL